MQVFHVLKVLAHGLHALNYILDKTITFTSSISWSRPCTLRIGRVDEACLCFSTLQGMAMQSAQHSLWTAQTTEIESRKAKAKDADTDGGKLQRKMVIKKKLLHKKQDAKENNGTIARQMARGLCGLAGQMNLLRFVVWRVKRAHYFQCFIWKTKRRSRKFWRDFLFAWSRTKRDSHIFGCEWPSNVAPKFYFWFPIIICYTAAVLPIEAMRSDSWLVFWFRLLCRDVAWVTLYRNTGVSARVRLKFRPKPLVELLLKMDQTICWGV